MAEPRIYVMLDGGVTGVVGDAVTRMGEATALWHQGNPGKENILPDLGTLLQWLMEEAR